MACTITPTTGKPPKTLTLALTLTKAQNANPNQTKTITLTQPLTQKNPVAGKTAQATTI